MCGGEIEVGEIGEEVIRRDDRDVIRQTIEQIHLGILEYQTTMNKQRQRKGEETYVNLLDVIEMEVVDEEIVVDGLRV